MRTAQVVAVSPQADDGRQSAELPPFTAFLPGKSVLAVGPNGILGAAVIHFFEYLGKVVRPHRTAEAELVVVVADAGMVECVEVTGALLAPVQFQAVAVVHFVVAAAVDETDALPGLVEAEVTRLAPCFDAAVVLVNQIRLQDVLPVVVYVLLTAGAAVARAENAPLSLPVITALTEETEEADAGTAVGHVLEAVEVVVMFVFGETAVGRAADP